MARFLALTRKEAAAILMNPPILFATAFFILLNSFAFYLTIAKPAAAYAVFDDIALFMLFTSIIMFPLVSMRSFSEENASGTLETLLTAPVSHFAAVMAKFLGAMAFVVVYLLHGLAYAALLSYGGDLDWHAALSAMLALCALGAFAMSLGVFVSALTVSPAAAAAGTGGFLIFLTIAADLDPYSGRVASVLNAMSFIPHAKRWIAGEIDTRGLVYFLSCTALFLFYAWLATGSRAPGAKATSRTARRRMFVTYLLVSAGFVLLVVQIALLHIRGFWETGVSMGAGMGRIPWRWFVPIALSVVAFVWSFFTYRAARRAERRDRAMIMQAAKYSTITESQVMGASRFYYGENLKARRRTAFAAIAALAVVLNLNWLANYPFRTFEGDPRLSFLSVLQERRWDVTQDGRNSLSPSTRKTLDGLQGRVQIYSFIPMDVEARGVPVAEEMRRLLERYGDYNGLVSVTYADAVNEPELADEMARELGVSREGLENNLVLDYHGRRLAIPVTGLVAPPNWRAQMAGETKWVFDGENRITQTVKRLVDPRVPNVFFTYGHLELSLYGGANAERSVSRLARAMAGANMRVRQHEITPQNPIPPECDIIVIASPRIAFLDNEVRELERYMNGGGRLLLFAPPVGDDFRLADDPLNALAFSLGGAYRDDVLQDPNHNDNGQALAPHGRSRGAGGEGGAADFVFPFSRTIRDNPRVAEGGWASERLIESYPSAVSTSFADGAMRPGPFTLIYRSSRTDGNREARMVAVAAGRMASDADIVRGANEPLLLGLTQWLAGREETQDIAPRIWVDRRLTLVGPQLRAILWLGVVALPLVWLMAGLSVWWVRRD